MSVAEKTASKRSKPSYFMSILGVTLVLFIVGVLGWVILNSRKLEQILRESATLNVFINETSKEKEKDTLLSFIRVQPGIKNYNYIDREQAKKEWLSQGNEDFNEFIDNMMLPRSVEVHFKSDYADSMHMAAFADSLQRFPFINEVKFPKEVVGKFDLLRKVSLGLGVVALLLLVLTVFLIDNTIRLAMFSNRFLIKTMQMVGATRWFIAKPMNLRAVINGATAALLSIIAIIALILSLESWVPELRGLRDNRMLFLLCSLILAIGVSITLISTYRSIVKYLKMKLDDLY